MNGGNLQIGRINLHAFQTDVIAESITLPVRRLPVISTASDSLASPSRGGVRAEVSAKTAPVPSNFLDLQLDRSQSASSAFLRENRAIVIHVPTNSLTFFGPQHDRFCASLDGVVIWYPTPP